MAAYFNPDERNAAKEAEERRVTMVDYVWELGCGGAFGIVVLLVVGMCAGIFGG